MPEIVALARHHDRSGFDCGVPELNSFLKATARQHADKGISRTFVLSDQENPAAILGYFTLTLCEVRTKHLPTAYAKKYPQHELPAVRLARLAVSKKYQRMGYGGLLLSEAIHRTVLIAEQAGMTGLFVDAKDERAHKFYEKYGFVALPGYAMQLFLPLETLRLSCNNKSMGS
ncbi:MAG: GNAT family N-acetyltransferase [Syntrophales bacterium]|nr:GNAT family N-acetyltransferase [Syntrophales bacterium]